MESSRERAAESAEVDAWLESLEGVTRERGPAAAARLLSRLIEHGQTLGVTVPGPLNTPYVNTIPVDRQPPYPGDRDIERRIKSLVRWNAMAMVVKANKQAAGIGGHISTYASAATLFEVGFHHFFRGRDSGGGDQIFLQGHASPGVYARAYLEGRISAAQLHAFRRELSPGGGLSSYPHPWLMPDFWQFPTVSMGLSPLSAIYQARFNRYLHARGLADTSQCRVWAFLGDGEMDEPESLGAITLASRERLDNLVFVINCNLQRLDGPVRGNGKIIQELEAAFRGAGWNVIKVVWGDDWDPLLARDDEGMLVRRMTDALDGDYQKYTVESGDYIRKHFFGTDPKLLRMVEGLTDAKLRKMRRGGHDPEKVYAAYQAAVEHSGSPTVVLAKTVKGWGLGEVGEGRNVTHQQKKLSEKELRSFRDRFGIPIGDRELLETPFYRPAEDSEEIQYLLERRRALGGFVPQRLVHAPALPSVPDALFEEFYRSTEDREVATTMVLVRLLRHLMNDPDIGRAIVPIVPDEARTFGMDALFRRYGIYSSAGQRYEPADSDVVAFYREAEDGQLLEEGITEAGAMASFSAAGTAYATHGVATIPFFVFYSMFGFQRVGDLIWQNADLRGRGFLVGATAGRTTLSGEGLQHQDGHSHLLASTVPTVRAYDPAYAYEIATIVREGIRRMWVEHEDVVYYLTVQNEMYPMPGMPQGAEEGILRGLYRLEPADGPASWPRIHLFGSGSILREAQRARQLLAEREVAASLWSVTSYSELRREALEAERWNRLHPGEDPRMPYVSRELAAEPWPIVAATDYMKIVADQIARFVPSTFQALGTDGFGRSDERKALRRFFEVDAEAITVAALAELARGGKLDARRAAAAIREFAIDPETPDPARR
ncbi:MAG TPA: pyruvate dehydrogenase (acetyl-transferring), homodimeric type [Candidatus Binatia bacterium]|nr:pyruvate dehydrogenase (acetyl-transferring), homodimeric type [Candidatus Binatia bacterium]